MSVERILERLDGVKGNGPWMAKCPSHEDRTPSLRIDVKDGRTLIKCFAGCEPLDILESIGLDWDSLFDGPHMEIWCCWNMSEKDNRMRLKLLASVKFCPWCGKAR